MDSLTSEIKKVTIDGDFKEWKTSEYNDFSRVAVVFYKETAEGPEFLLNSKSTDGVWTTPQTNFHGVDAAATFTAVRAILEQTYGCLAPSLLKKVQSQEKISEGDLIMTEVRKVLAFSINYSL